MCAQQLLRRRKNKQHCNCLRVSQDAVTKYWKLCDESRHDKNDTNDTRIPARNLDVKDKTVTSLREHKCKEETSMQSGRNVKHKEEEKGISMYFSEKNYCLIISRLPTQSA